jgi:hypothetical protein
MADTILLGPAHARRDRLDFSNRIKKTAIEQLAEMDEHEVVREVQVISHAVETADPLVGN